MALALGNLRSVYSYDSEWLLVRQLKIGGSVQKDIHMSWRVRMLYLAHPDRKWKKVRVRFLCGSYWWSGNYILYNDYISHEEQRPRLGFQWNGRSDYPKLCLITSNRVEQVGTLADIWLQLSSAWMYVKENYKSWCPTYLMDLIKGVLQFT